MDGTVLPPVIFTDYPKVPKDLEQGTDAKVLYVEGITQPTADLTLRWLDEVSEYLDDSPLVIHDRGPEYMAKSVQEDIASRGISTLSIPSAGGAFINPCDNSFNSELRHKFFLESQHSYEDKLRGIIDAYYAPKEASMLKYFEHVGWSGTQPTRRQVQRLVSEGYRTGKKNIQLYEEMEQTYAGWQKNLRRKSLKQGMKIKHSPPTNTWYVWK